VPAGPAVAEAHTFSPHEYADLCTVCGTRARFRRDGYSIRETYQCPRCRGSLRYREQAAVLVQLFSRHGAATLAQLAREDHFRGLRIYEPGLVGPFRQYLRPLPRYQDSYYWPDVARGEVRDGVRCEDMMALTFPDQSFDLIITSDIMEHVRRPLVAFQELRRILAPGGVHVFSIPVVHPMPRRSVSRVDTSSDVDVHVLPPHYHGAPLGGRSLVYTDFGADIVDQLRDVGLPTTIVRTRSAIEELQSMLTFYSVKG
jgi:SAM-dependent methyltransferase